MKCPAALTALVAVGSLAAFLCLDAWPATADALKAPAASTPTLPTADTPGIADIVNALRKAMEVIEKERRSALTAILKRHLDSLQDMLQEKKKTRNVTGIAIANAGIGLFQAAITNLNATGQCEFPSKVRRELEPVIAGFNADAAPVLAKASAAADRAFAAALESFSAIGASLNPGVPPDPTDPAFAARLKELIQTPGDAPQSERARQPATASLASASDTNRPAPSATAPPVVLASSGDVEQWTTVATWRGAMMGMDVVSIPVAEVAVGTNTTRQFNPMSNQDSELTYIVYTRLTITDGMRYRLMQVPDNQGVEIMEWPTKANQFQLVIRTPAKDGFPSYHGFDLQVGIPGRALAALSNQTLQSRPAEKPPSSTVIAFSTAPDGAAVYVDGTPLRNTWTPCRILLSPGAHTVGFSLPGYSPLVITNQQFQGGETLRLVLQPDPRVQRASLVIAANAKSWTRSDVTVSRGDNLSIRAEGSWSCGPGREQCDASGYPNDQTFIRYYMDSASFPRRTTSAHYCALILKIGEKGRLMAVGKSLNMVATEAGPLYFDVNEADTGDLRGDNAGSQQVRILVTPPALPPGK